MIDYDKAQRIKEILKQIEEFDDKWLGPKGIFNVMHKVGAISGEDHQAIIDEYDRVMAPVYKVENKVKGYVAERIQRFLWNAGLADDASTTETLPRVVPNSQPKEPLTFVDKVKSLFK